MAILNGRTSAIRHLSSSIQRVCLFRTSAKKALLAGAAGLLVIGSGASFATTERVSIASDGTEDGGYIEARNHGSLLSADGRFVTFQSSATNLAPNDENDKSDVFVHDRKTGETTLVSVSSTGTQGNGDSWARGISADGQYVLFASTASNLVSGDTNGTSDVFVHNRSTGETERVSVSTGGIEGNGQSLVAVISSDGSNIAFSSSSSNLVDGDTNGKFDVFVRNRSQNTTRRVSVDSNGVEANSSSTDMSINADGRYVAFLSHASNLVDDDGNGQSDNFVHDLVTGTTERVNFTSDGTEISYFSRPPAISPDGRYVVYRTTGGHGYPGSRPLVIHDRLTKENEFIADAYDSFSGGSDYYWTASISADNRFVTFFGAVPDATLPHNESQKNGNMVFVYDRLTKTVENISENKPPYSEFDAFMQHPSISADGKVIAFTALDGDLVKGDTNEHFDVFVHYINQVPRFYTGDNPTVCKNAGNQSILNWATGVDDGDPLGQQQKLTFETTSNDNPALFGGLLDVGGGPLVSEDGTLRFRPALHEHGYARVCVRLKDDGGTSRDGQDTSAEQCFRITVDPNCDDGAGELFSAGQFDFSWILEDIGNVPLDAVNFGSQTAKVRSYNAVVTNNSGATQHNVRVKMQLSGQDEVLSSDTRCDAVDSSGQFHCDVDELPEGDTEFYFQVKADGDVTAKAEFTPANDASVAGETGSNSGGGSLGWLTLLGASVLGRRRLRQQH